jgi:hypothetical protein
VSETSRRNVRTPTVHAKSFNVSKNAHWNHEPICSSPSPPPEERAGERRPFGDWLLELLWDLEFELWSFRHARSLAGGNSHVRLLTSAATNLRRTLSMGNARKNFSAKLIFP